jgi:hypothetical protein
MHNKFENPFPRRALYCGSGAAPQTNTNQAAVTQQTTQTTQQLTAAQTSLAQAIINDSGNDTPNIPTPAGLPTVQSVTGELPQVLPTESTSGVSESADPTSGLLYAAGSEAANNLTATDSQTQDAVNSSQASTNAAITSAENNAAAGITASANGTNLGLGTQASFAPVDPNPSSGTSSTAATTAPSQSNGLLPLILLGGGGVAIYFFIKHEHKAA